MIQKIPYKPILIVYSVLILIWRVFRFQLEKWNVEFTSYCFLCIIAITPCLFLFTILLSFKNKVKPLLILSMVTAFTYFIPFEFVLSWIGFRFNSKLRQQIITNLKEGIYDSIIARDNSVYNGTWIENTPLRCKVFKNVNLQAIFIPQGEIDRGGDEVYGLLYVSDPYYAEKNSTPVFTSTNQVKLARNWYWVDNVYDLTPGP